MKFIMIILINFLFGTTVVVQSEKTSNVAYQKHLGSHANKISFVDYQIRESGKKELDQKLKKAQFEFLKGSLKNSSQLFNEIAKLRHSFHWGLAERNKIQYAILRAAQLETNTDTQKKLVQKAVIFDTEIDPDHTLYPPPLMALFHKTRKSLENKTWALPDKATEYDAILINGKKVENQTGFLEAPSGIYSITFLSNKYQSFEVTTQLEDLADIILPLIPLAQGGCGKWQLSQKLKNNDILELFDNGCLSIESQLPLTEQLAFVNPPKEENKKTPRFLKNKWFWIGVSVVAVGLTWHSLSQKDGSPGTNGNQPLPAENQPVVFTN